MRGRRVRVLALGIRGLHRATWSREFAPRRSRLCEGAHKAIWVLCSVHPAKAGTALSAGACAHAQAPPLGPKPWTSGAFGFPGWGLRVEPSLGK